MLDDALQGLKVPSIAALTAAQTTSVNADLQSGGCPPIVTTASLAEQAFKSIRFPRPSGDRSPSASLRYQDLAFSYVNLQTFFWTSSASWRVLSATASAAGLSATVSARPVELDYTPGDGGATVVCPGPGRPWTTADGNSPPSAGACAYAYRRVSTRPITTTQSILWRISWAGTGNTSGDIPSLTTSTSSQMQILQIEAVDR